MILPSKHLSQHRATLTVGAGLLAHLAHPKTVSALWDDISVPSIATQSKKPALRYDAYILALDLLFLIGAIELHEGLLNRKKP